MNPKKKSLSARRAWIEMLAKFGMLLLTYQSLSARRAWIEISPCLASSAENVSLSARRAWIEIDVPVMSLTEYGLSLSARRAWIEIYFCNHFRIRQDGRSPQGERG